MASTLNQYPQRDALYRIMPEGIAAHNRYEDRIVLLDWLSSEIWLRADGMTRLRDIASDIAGMSGIDANTMQRTISIVAVLLNSEGILFLENTPSDLPYHLAFPQEDQDLDQMHQSMVAAGWLEE